MQRESSSLEYKETITNTFLKTVSAYANYGTGRVIFGIADDGKVKGIPDPVQKCLDIETKINDSITPTPHYALEVNAKDKTIILTVNKGEDTPYLYKSKAYRRNDSATIAVDRLELNRLILRGTHRYFEDQPSDKKNLHFHELTKKLKAELDIKKTNMDVLKTLGFLDAEHQYNRAAALFADENPFPGVDCMEFGASLDEIKGRKTFAGHSLLSIYEESAAWISRHYQYEKVDGLQRKKVEQIPEKAIREALANSLVHRVWDIRAAVQVALFPDRLEITSPGGLPEGITEDEYLYHHISILRNPKVANLFYRMGYIESFGTGIQRILRAYQDTNVTPRFKISQHAIEVTLPSLTSAPPLDQEEKTLCQFLSENGILTRQEIAAATHYDKSKTLRILNRLIEKQCVEKVGKGRGTKYRITVCFFNGHK